MFTTILFQFDVRRFSERHEGKHKVMRGMNMGNKKVKRKLGANIGWILILAILIIFVAYLVMGYVAKI